MLPSFLPSATFISIAMCLLLTETGKQNKKPSTSMEFIGECGKTNKWADSCNLCARDIVDSCNSADWVQLNQPGEDRIPRGS